MRRPGGAVARSRSQKGQALGQFVAFLACAGQQQMATLGYSPLPPNLVQEDFDAIGRLNGGVEPPPVSAATCKNPYVDGQIPLPGEPPVAGQTCPPQGCGVNVATPGSGGSGGATGGATGGGSGGADLGNKGAGSGSVRARGQHQGPERGPGRRRVPGGQRSYRQVASMPGRASTCGPTP